MISISDKYSCNTDRNRKSFIKCISVCLAIAVLNLSVSCSYFTVKDVPITEETIAKNIKSFNASEKYVIVHSNSLSWHLKDMVLDNGEQNISGTIKALSLNHRYKNERSEKRVHRYRRADKDPLNEVHFYLKSETALQENEWVNIPFQDIDRISVNDKNTGKSIANVFFGTVGAAAFVTLLVAALKSSCPYVYIKNGKEFDFVGELYPGTLTANMQEDDYLGLPNFASENGLYALRIANHLKEIQYTDRLQLISLNHPQDTEVLFDSKGDYQTFSELVSPVSAAQAEKSYNLDLVLSKDNTYYAFNETKTTLNSTRSIIFDFPKPNNAEEVKLYLTAKNSVWLDYVFGKFNEQFGDYYNTYQKKQQTVKKKDLIDWRNNQNIALSVYIKTNQGWELVERLKTVGPLAMRNLVVPIKLKYNSDEILQIKLETGFMFWEVDYVGVDYSENLDLNVNYIDPLSAIDHKGNDVTDLLDKTDGNYFVQPNIGDEFMVYFPEHLEEDSTLKTTLYLKNRGYYNYIRDYKGIPDRERLESFRKDAAFTKFSETSYFDYINYERNNLAQNE